MKKQKGSRTNKQSNIIVAVIFISAIFLMSVGYASLNAVLNMDGFILIIPPEDNGIVEIVGFERVSNRNVSRQATATQTNEVTIDFGNITYSGAGNTVYQVQINNNSLYDWVYNGAKTTITKTNGTTFQQTTYNVGITGITEGDILKSNESVRLTVTMTANRAMSATAICEFEFENTFKGSLKGFVQVARVDLTETNLRPVRFVLSSSYEDDRTFTIAASDSDFIFVDADGNELGTFTAHNGINQYEVYIKYNENVEFLEPIHNVKIVISPDGLSKQITSSFEVTTPYNADLIDELAPQIGPIYIQPIAITGKADIVWSRTDSGGSSVQGYNILIYNQSGVLQQEIVTDDSTTTYTMTESDVILQNGDYYVVIYGRDSFNDGSEYVSSATTSTTNARKSESTSLVWTFTVTFDTGNYTYTGGSTVGRAENYRAQMTGNTRPDSLTITMAGTALTTNTDESSYYTYDSTTGDIYVHNVQGNLQISTNGCLVEGTKILLADGSTKNVEDITYNDLLLVWDYEHGIFTYEYPIWIEKVNSSNSYQLTTFSDNSTLKTVTYHGIYSQTSNKFVNINNSNDFKIGDVIPKVVKENGEYKFKNVKVKNIETINEKVNYYEIVTTTYYNVISDNYLTTDGIVELVNMYGFNEDITWKELREVEDLLDYNDVSDVIPYYLFKGLRAGEIKYFIKKGLINPSEIESYKRRITVLNNSLLENVPTNSNGRRLWNITTSFDDNNIHLYEEGSIYKLPNIQEDDFIGFYNTADGKLYNSNDEYQVIYSTHFIAKYKQD